MYTYTTTSKYAASAASEARSKFLDDELAALHQQREHDAKAVMPWLSSYGATTTADTDADATFSTSNISPLVQHSSGSILCSLYDENNAATAAATTAHMTPRERTLSTLSDPLKKVQYILRSWKARSVRSAFMKLYKHAFVNNTDVAARNAEQFSGISSSAVDAEELSNCYTIIEQLRHENSDLGHQVKQLLLQTFSLKTAAITVVEHSRLDEEKKCEESAAELSAARKRVAAGVGGGGEGGSPSRRAQQQHQQIRSKVVGGGR
jgi:hypothetical protein